MTALLHAAQTTGDAIAAGGWILAPGGWIVAALAGALLLASPQNVRAGWPRVLLCAVVACVALVYLEWRLLRTAPAPDAFADGLFFYGVLAIELAGWAHGLILLMTLALRPDRSDETSRRAAVIAARASDELPVVDVMIPTYNEEIEILERTVMAAMSLRWPHDKLRVHVLDDGKRPWLREFCKSIGVGYMTREGNAHAKAGNLNAAFARTDAPFILVLDADFVAQPDMLRRMMGWFDDPRVGIVQSPQRFFNLDPLQNVPALRNVAPGDQRFFFNEIMVGRDGWDCAFCCGSNGIIRREALDAIGGEMPTGSITEDILLTMAMLRKGYITRYVNEKLAIGLAPESLAAFFVQRSRWARGAVQTLFLKEGPFGPGLTLIQRAMFLPTHWVSGVLSAYMLVCAPIIGLVIGESPFGSIPTAEVALYAIPTTIAMIGALCVLAPGSYNPLAAVTLSLLQAFRIGPAILWSCIRPRSAIFKVTPKGADATEPGDRASGRIMIGLAGISLAVALIGSAEIGMGALFAIPGAILLLFGAAVSMAAPSARSERRVSCDEPVRIMVDGASDISDARIVDISPSGFCLALDHSDRKIAVGDLVVVESEVIGALACRIAWLRNDAIGCRVIDTLRDRSTRLAMMRLVFCTGAAADDAEDASFWRQSLMMIVSIFMRDGRGRVAATVNADSDDAVRTRAAAMMTALSRPDLAHALALEGLDEPLAPESSDHGDREYAVSRAA